MTAHKDDTKDSKWIGDLFRLRFVKGSYIPCKKIRILREYTRLKSVQPVSVNLSLYDSYTFVCAEKGRLEQNGRK